MKYQKMVDLKRAMGSIVKNEELVRALFEEIPDLKTFSWTKTREYDDNNYFVSTRVVSINGHDYGYDGYEEDDEEDCGLPKVTATHMVEDLVDQISDSYDLSDDEIVMDRDDYFLESEKGESNFHPLTHIWMERRALKERKQKDEVDYFLAFLSGCRLPDDFFVGKDPKLAVYHAMDHGRLSEEVEVGVFAVRGNMSYALDYARTVGRLSPKVEAFFILDNDEYDRETFQIYIGEFGKK